MTPLTKYEKETIVNYNAGEEMAIVYTRDKTVMRRLDRFVEDFPNIYSLVGQDEVSKTYSMPKTYVNYRKPRVLSEKHKEKARERMEMINKNNKYSEI